jgi:hypothetical protein
MKITDREKFLEKGRYIEPKEGEWSVSMRLVSPDGVCYGAGCHFLPEEVGNPEKVDRLEFFFETAMRTVREHK